MQEKIKKSTKMITFLLLGLIIIPLAVDQHEFASEIEATPTAKVAAIATPTMPLAVRVKGSVKPAVSYTEEKSALIKEGFRVTGGGYRSITDQNGEFILSVRYYPYEVDISIEKPGYLKRTLQKVNINRMTTELPPIEMWAGDMNADDAINMADIMYVAKTFNSVKGDSEFVPDADFDKDDVINMMDVMIIAKNFNATSDNYPSYQQMISVTPSTVPVTAEIVYPKDGDEIDYQFGPAMGNVWMKRSYKVNLSSTKEISKVEYYIDDSETPKVVDVYPYTLSVWGGFASYSPWNPGASVEKKEKCYVRVIYKDGSTDTSKVAEANVIYRGTERHYLFNLNSPVTLTSSPKEFTTKTKIVPICDDPNNIKIRFDNRVLKVQLQDENGKGIPGQKIKWNNRYYSQPIEVSETDENGMISVEYKFLTISINGTPSTCGETYKDTTSFCYEGMEKQYGASTLELSVDVRSFDEMIEVPH